MFFSCMSIFFPFFSLIYNDSFNPRKCYILPVILRDMTELFSIHSDIDRKLSSSTSNECNSSDSAIFLTSFINSPQKKASYYQMIHFTFDHIISDIITVIFSPLPAITLYFWV